MSQPSLETARQRLEGETQLSQIETLALRIAFLFHTGEVQRPAGSAGVAITSLVAMLTNELLGFCGTIRSGALHAAWHHVRAVTELDASLHYLFDQPSKRENRVQQFVEFVGMLPWLKRRQLEVALGNGEISQEDLDRKNLVNDALIAHATPEKVASWVAIFEVKSESKLLNRRRWHTGTVEDLFRGKDPSGRAFAAYETLCHATGSKSGTGSFDDQRALEFRQGGRVCFRVEHRDGLDARPPVARVGERSFTLSRRPAGEPRGSLRWRKVRKPGSSDRTAMLTPAQVHYGRPLADRQSVFDIAHTARSQHVASASFLRLERARTTRPTSLERGRARSSRSRGAAWSGVAHFGDGCRQAVRSAIDPGPSCALIHAAA